jgi:LPS sulfotransferase NodH
MQGTCANLVHRSGNLGMKPAISYIVASVQRSGTHLLCSILRSAGAGSPDEYFFLKYGETWEERWGSPSRVAYLERIFQQHTTADGVFGFVVMWVYFDRVVQMLQEIPAYKNFNESQLLAAVFNRPKYIWMRRRNRVQQAVSWAIALQTGVWAQKKGDEPQLRAVPRFDFNVIDDLYNRIVDGEVGWTNYFHENQIDPLVLFYEDVVASNLDAARRVLEFLGVPFPPACEIAPPTVQKQGTQLSEEWAASYLKLKENKIGKLARIIRRIRN